jgi:hypothetical protein
MLDFGNVDPSDERIAKVIATLNDMIMMTGPIKFTAQGMAVYAELSLEGIFGDDPFGATTPDPIVLGLDVCVLTVVVRDWDGRTVGWHTVEGPMGIARGDLEVFVTEGLQACLKIAMAKSIKVLAMEYFEVNDSGEAFDKFEAEFGVGLDADSFKLLVDKMRTKRQSRSASDHKWEALLKITNNADWDSQFWAWLETNGYDVLQAADYADEFLLSVGGAS